MGYFARVSHPTILFCPKLALYRRLAFLQFFVLIAEGFTTISLVVCMNGQSIMINAAFNSHCASTDSTYLLRRCH